MKTFNAVLSRFFGKPILAEVIVPQAIVAEVRYGIPTKEKVKLYAERLKEDAKQTGFTIKDITINSNYHPNNNEKGYAFIHAYSDNEKDFKSSNCCIHIEEYINCELFDTALRKELNI